MKRLILTFLFLFLLTVSAVPSTSAQEAVTLTYLINEGQTSEARAKALVAAFTAKNPNITIQIELRPGGTEGDNIVKTRLATGDMTDLFFYNSGSLFQALNPAQTLVDLTGQPFVGNIVESFFPTVTQGGGIYGIPGETAMGGGILYNKAVYKQLGLNVPQTWEQFVANNAAIAKAGVAPVLATFGDTWTSQLFVLADYYNVEKAVPGFADAYTANKAKYATTPAAMAGFQYLQQGYELGWWQQDYATTRFEPGLAILAEGKAAHFPMLTFAISTIATNFPDKIEDIGFFAQPGTDAKVNGATIWMPAAMYIPKTTTGAKLDASLKFLAFVASVEGTDVMTSVEPPAGPYLIKGAQLPDTVPGAVKDLAAYIESGNSYPALEFLSPIKGPNLEQLCVAVATGQTSAAQAAADYDLDVERQAQQLGLAGW